jgi:ATP-binding cassette subfamily B protein
LIHAAVTVVLTIGLLAWAILLWQDGRISTGDVVLACTLGLSVLHATRDLAVALVDITQHFARLSEAIATLLVPHDLNDHPDAAPLRHAGASVEIRNVVFQYPGDEKVFNNLNLRIEPGQRIGLIGPSGAGKSTLFSLLQRFYDVQHGKIFIDGQDIRRVTLESLREAIAVVPQDVSLFHRTVMENIRYARPSASDRDVTAAARAARCLEFIEKMPRGMETIVGDRGLKLSGGQRQRIAIARALLKNAPLVLLDEATSALDSESEDAIAAALAVLMRGRTVLAIAHRHTTLRSFDRIVELRDGRVMRDGKPEQLLLGFRGEMAA